MIQEASGNRPVQEEALKELEQRYRPAVERSLRREILLAAIAHQEGLTITDEEVAAEIERMVEADPRQASRVRARYQSHERRHSLAEALQERKAMGRLIETAAVNEETLGGRVVPAGR